MRESLTITTEEVARPKDDRVKRAKTRMVGKISELWNAACGTAQNRRGFAYFRTISWRTQLFLPVRAASI